MLDTNLTNILNFHSVHTVLKAYTQSAIMDALLRCPAPKTKINGLIQAPVVVSVIVLEKIPSNLPTKRPIFLCCLRRTQRHDATAPRGCSYETDREASKELIIQLKVNGAKPFGFWCSFCLDVTSDFGGHGATALSAAL